jgi:hypothetical protein
MSSNPMVRRGGTPYKCRGTRPQSVPALARAVGDVVYFIRCADGLIKIGWTRTIARRRTELTSGWANLLAIKPGTFADEQALHHALRAHIAHGREYYHPTPEIMGLINEIRGTYGLSLIAA